ncbi:hypothetical protein [Flavobacterium sp.]|uniref:hypothetical protein n=1 Tax=Flavobacterium sp. TaxID=239 RepID=UPI0025E69246|nr:hypothetical protein [Flavobacterium sp.]
MIKSKHNINTGKLIEQLLSQLKFTNSEIENAIGRPGSSMYKYIRNESIQTGILIDLCYAMKYNIFQDIANDLPSEFSKTDRDAQEKLAFKTANEKRIANLEEENKIMKIQLDLLMKLKT